MLVRGVKATHAYRILPLALACTAGGGYAVRWSRPEGELPRSPWAQAGCEPGRPGCLPERRPPRPLHRYFASAVQLPAAGLVNVGVLLDGTCHGLLGLDVVQVEHSSAPLPLVNAAWSHRGHDVDPSVRIPPTRLGARLRSSTGGCLDWSTDGTSPCPEERCGRAAITPGALGASGSRHVSIAALVVARADARRQRSTVATMPHTGVHGRWARSCCGSPFPEGASCGYAPATGETAVDLKAAIERVSVRRLYPERVGSPPPRCRRGGSRPRRCSRPWPARTALAKYADVSRSDRDGRVTKPPSSSPPCCAGPGPRRAQGEASVHCLTRAARDDRRPAAGTGARRRGRSAGLHAAWLSAISHRLPTCRRHPALGDQSPGPSAYFAGAGLSG